MYYAVGFRWVLMVCGFLCWYDFHYFSVRVGFWCNLLVGVGGWCAGVSGLILCGLRVG